MTLYCTGDFNYILIANAQDTGLQDQCPNPSQSNKDGAAYELQNQRPNPQREPGVLKTLKRLSGSFFSSLPSSNVGIAAADGRRCTFCCSRAMPTFKTAFSALGNRDSAEERNFKEATRELTAQRILFTTTQGTQDPSNLL